VLTTWIAASGAIDKRYWRDLLLAHDDEKVAKAEIVFSVLFEGSVRR
jgi:hypothetical protein